MSHERRTFALHVCLARRMVLWYDVRWPQGAAAAATAAADEEGEEGAEEAGTKELVLIPSDYQMAESCHDLMRQLVRARQQCGMLSGRVPTRHPCGDGRPGGLSRAVTPCQAHGCIPPFGTWSQHL